MAECAPVEAVHLNYPSNCTHGCTYTIAEEDLSLRLLQEWVVICVEMATISFYSFLDILFSHR